MNFQLCVADIDPKRIALREGISRLNADRFIYEHLRYYCSKFFPLPAITVEIMPGSIEAVDSGIYLQIARDLDLPLSRAIVSPSSDESTVRKLAGNGEILLLDYDKVRSEEELIGYGWHIFFFESPISEENADLFRGMIEEQFKGQAYLTETEKINAVKSFSHSHSRTCVEFQGLTPFENHTWARELRIRLFEFHNDVARIVSYQGRRFVDNDSGI